MVGLVMSERRQATDIEIGLLRAWLVRTDSRRWGDEVPPLKTWAETTVSLDEHVLMFHRGKIIETLGVIFHTPFGDCPIPFPPAPTPFITPQGWTEVKS